MTRKNLKKTNRRQHMVRVIKNTFVEGVFYNAGAEVAVSQDYYQRVKAERDGQVICL